jgi:hypothetical protein
MNFVQMSRSLSCFLFMQWRLAARLVYPLFRDRSVRRRLTPATGIQPPFTGSLRPASPAVRILSAT